MKNWTEIKPYKDDPDGYTVWISGIYKIVSYRPGEYLAFFIQPWFNNWGDHVCAPPHDLKYGKGWKTLAQAKADCVKHSKTHEAGEGTIKRAAEIMADMIKQAA